MQTKRILVAAVSGLAVVVLSGTPLGESRRISSQRVQEIRVVHPTRTTPTHQKQLEQNLHWGVPFGGGGFAEFARQLPPARVDPDSGARLSQTPANRFVPPPSPGIPLSSTSFDYQYNHSAGYQIGRTSAGDVVHFCWTQCDRIPPDLSIDDRFVNYSAYRVSTGELLQPYGGAYVSLGYFARAGFPNVDVQANNTAQVVFQQRPEMGFPLSSWHLAFPVEGLSLHLDEELQQPADLQLLWPRIEVQENYSGGFDVYHVLGHVDESDLVVYWRNDGTTWQGPVPIDSSFSLGYALASDPFSNKAAIVLHIDAKSAFRGLNLNNIAYYESQTRGAGWISGTERGDVNRHLLTDYNNSLGPQAWLHIAAVYDHAGRLHVIWDEQRFANASADIVIRHWNSERGTVRPVAFGYWPSSQSSGVFNLNLAKMTVGVGDGSSWCSSYGGWNFDWLYVLYTQFSGPTPSEQADASGQGFYNGELYLTVSPTHGNTWSPPVNLTQTKTPDCDPGLADPVTGLPTYPENVCRSEHWGTIGREVRDIDIIYISDKDAGGAPYGQGTWQMNEVMYLRIPGTGNNPPVVCPPHGPKFAATLSSRPDCPYQARPGEVRTETLTLVNTGTDFLAGSVSVTMGGDWLSVSPAGGYFVPEGGPDEQRTVIMNAGALTEAIHFGWISVTHNDTTIPSPVIFEVQFHVTDDSICVGCEPTTLTCSACSCPCDADPQCDGVVNVLDVVHGVNVAFRGAIPVRDPACPYDRTDVDCSGFTNVIDVVKFVNVAFRGSDPGSQFCEPCLPRTQIEADADVTPTNPEYLKAKSTPGWCGTQELWDVSRADTKQLLQAGYCPTYGLCDLPEVRDTTSVSDLLVGVIVHVIHDGWPEPIPDSVAATITQMNRDFAANCAGIQFCLNKTVYHDAGANAWIDTGAAAFSDIAAFKSNYAESPESFCNIYVSGQTPVNELLGLATFPWDANSTGKFGGLWINRIAIGIRAHTATHEMAHCLGLYHTHHGVSEVDAGYENSPCDWPCYEFASGFESDERGDFSGDTPPSPISFSCAPPGGGDCQQNPWGQAQPQNYMGYGPDSCITLFTMQQIQRMQCWTKNRLSGWIKAP